MSPTFGDVMFGGRRKPPTQTMNEAWTSLTPGAARPDSSQEGLQFGSPGQTSQQLSGNDDKVEIPDVYRVDREDSGPSVAGKPLLPDFALWIGLKGGNGLWQKRKALVEWRYQLAEHRESEANRIEEIQWARKAKKEADEKRRLDREELQKRVEEDAVERKRRLFIEKERLAQQKMEEEEQKRVLAEKRERMHKPRPCKVCTGSGKCIPCQGKGCNLTLFLAPVVNDRTTTLCGQLPRGCSACGGCGDDAWWGEFLCGSGACQSCTGKGQVPAPPNGWPDCQ